MAGNTRGAAWMIVAAISFSCSMAMVKFLGDDFPATVQSFYRQAIGLIIVLPLLLRDPLKTLKTSRPFYMVSRTAATSMGLILYYSAYHYLPLAQANALSFTRQLFIVPLAMLLLKETVEWRRMAATITGFAGVIVVLHPGTGDSAGSILNIGALYCLIASLLIAWSIVGVKSMSKDHGQLTLLCWSAILGVVFTLPGALLEWRTPDSGQLLLLGVMGALSTFTQFAYIRGMTMGDATAMAPIDYTRILFMSLFGYIFFGEVPSHWTLAGAAIIIGAAIYVTMDSRRRPVLSSVR